MIKKTSKGWGKIVEKIVKNYKPNRGYCANLYKDLTERGNPVVLNGKGSN